MGPGERIARGARPCSPRPCRARRPGPRTRWQAAIARVPFLRLLLSAADTDWTEIAALYGALLPLTSRTPVVRREPGPPAVAMAEGPAAGLALLDEGPPPTGGWPAWAAAAHPPAAELLGPPGPTEPDRRSRALTRRLLDLAPRRGPEAGLHRPPASANWPAEPRPNRQ